jgi:hypothetical protein
VFRSALSKKSLLYLLVLSTKLHSAMKYKGALLKTVSLNYEITGSTDYKYEMMNNLKYIRIHSLHNTVYAI